MQKQIKVLEDLQAQTGLVFKNGAKDALDFLDSIELVATAMAISSSNIKDFIDGFKSEDLLALDLADKLGQGAKACRETLPQGGNGLKGCARAVCVPPE